MSSRVLIVEDDIMQQTVLAAALAKRGYEVDVANDGLSAVRKLRNGGYDLALIDYNLPEIDGLTSARLFCDLVPSADRPKLIAISASVDDLFDRERNDKVFDAIIPKPLELPSLLQVVDIQLQTLTHRATDRSALATWLELGLTDIPSAKAVPSPDPAQAQILRSFFDISGRRPPEMILLLKPAHECALHTLRGEGVHHLLPIVDLSADSPCADASFSVADHSTWATVATTVTRFAQRRQVLAESIHLTLDFDLRLLAYIHLSGKPFCPHPDAEHRDCVSYPGFFPPLEVRTAVERLAANGYLERRFFERFHVCAGCFSSRLNVREECPRCHSAHQGDIALVHHFRCAHQAPESDFIKGAKLVCPKCRQQLRHYGSDYDRPGNACSCNSCGTISPEPSVGFVCLDCGSRTPGDAINTRDIFTYSLTDRGLAILRSGTQALPPPPSAPVLSSVSQQWEHTGQSAALVALRYRARDRIVARIGHDGFDRARRILVGNLVSVLEADCTIEPAGDCDHLIIRLPTQAQHALLDRALLRDCQRELTEDLEPDLEILHWPL